MTLEPCCHFGKQPPCVDAIIEHKIRKVYCGSDDPNAMVAGKGFKRLRDAGIEVYTHCLKAECDAINGIFFKYIVNKQPYVTMKYAMTMDGRIATHTGASKWITGEASRAYVMELRNRHKGIMAGIGTVLADDPMLTCRIEKSTDRDTDNVRNPIRIVCDSKLRIPENSQIVQTAGEIETIVATTAAGASDSAKCERLKDKGVSIIEIEDVDGQVDLRQLMTILGGKGIDGILLEGGGELNYSMVSEGLVDEACVFIAPKIFGGEGKYSPVSGTGVDVPADAHMFGLDEVRRFDEDVMLRYKKV